MGSVIVEINCNSDPARLQMIYGSLVGFQMPGLAQVAVELDASVLLIKIGQLSENLLSTTRFRFVKSATPGVVRVSFDFPRPHDIGLDTVEITFDAEDTATVVEALKGIPLLTDVEMLDALLQTA